MGPKLDESSGQVYDKPENSGPPLSSSDISRGISEAEQHANSTDGQSSATSSKEGGLYKPSPSGGKGKNKSTKLKGRFTRKQKGAAGGIGVLLGGGLIGFFMLLPSADILKLDFALGRSSAVSSLAAETRIYGFTRQARAYRTGDIGETRVGFLGSKSFNKIVDRLESQHGITFDRRDANGRPTRIRIEPPESSILRGATPEETRANIIKHLNLPDDGRLQAVGGSRGITVNSALLTGESSAELDKLIKSLVELDNESANKTRGATITSVRSRVFRKFWNAPSLYNPINRVAADIDESVRVRLDARRKQKAGKTATLSSKYQTKVAQARARLGSKATVASGALTFTGGLCLLKETADLLPALNYANIVLPAMEEAIDKQAVASQVRYGQDFDSEQLGIITDTFKDDQGKNIWGAKALNATANGTPGVGTEATPVLSQAFNMRGGSIAGLIDLIVAGSGENDLIEAFGGVGDTGAALACNPIGYGIQVIAGVGLLLTGPPGWAAKSAQVAQGLAISALITSLLGNAVEGQVENRAKEFCGQDEEGITVDAEAYGNCMAYAARAASNANTAAMGGVELSNTQERVAMMKLEQKELEEFREKSFLARMFDMKDHRSLAVNTLHIASKNQLQDVTRLAPNVFAGSTSIVGNLSSAFTKSAHAQASPYNWGENFNLVSVPLEILEDPKYDDPFENATLAASILREDLGNGSEIIKRAKKCFGVDIKQVTGRWQSTPVEEVVPMEDEYVEASCNDLSEENWVRIMLFVFDDSIVTAIDCYEEGDTSDSCREIGSGSGTSLNGVATSTGELDCSGYNKVGGSGNSVTKQDYNSEIQQNCQEIKQRCENGSVENTERILCEALKYDGVLYGNSYSERWSNGSVRATYGFNTNVGNFGIQAQAWQSQRNPEGLNPNNLLECSGLTSVALYDAFGFDGANVGCSGNYTQRNNPSIFRQLEPSEVRPGDLLTLTFSCNSDTSGHVAIAASGVDENGNIIVYETNSWGNPVRFTQKNLDRDFPAGRSRYIGQGAE